MRETASSKVAAAVVISNKERTIVLFLCLLAALRVFLFSAAFPFFNNVDEQAHFDLVLKYEHGTWPHGLDKFSPETSRYLALYSGILHQTVILGWKFSSAELEITRRRV